jgi:hypothetical protein
LGGRGRGTGKEAQLTRQTYILKMSMANNDASSPPVPGKMLEFKIYEHMYRSRVSRCKKCIY